MLQVCFITTQSLGKHSICFKSTANDGARLRSRAAAAAAASTAAAAASTATTAAAAAAAAAVAALCN